MLASDIKCMSIQLMFGSASMVPLSCGGASDATLRFYSNDRAAALFMSSCLVVDAQRQLGINVSG